MERTAAIGLRRAPGTRSRHVTARFLSEPAALGLLGGLAGASLGVVTVWTPVIDLTTPATAPGLATGPYPAWRAARVTPRRRRGGNRCGHGGTAPAGTAPPRPDRYITPLGDS